MKLQHDKNKTGNLQKSEIAEYLKQLRITVFASYTNKKSWKFALMNEPAKEKVEQVLQRFPGAAFTHSGAIPYFKVPRAA